MKPDTCGGTANETGICSRCARFNPIRGAPCSRAPLDPVTFVIIQRRHSGFPHTHYVRHIDDPDLPELLRHCGIEGTVDDVRASLSTTTQWGWASHPTDGSSAYWVSRGQADSSVDFDYDGSYPRRSARCSGAE